MNDEKTTLQALKQRMEKIVAERDWKQFHTPKNISMAIATEAAELMELFLWCDGQQSYAEFERNREAVEHELADILAYLLAFANRTGIDISTIFERKCALNEQKYPVEKAKGKSLKYTQL